MKHPKLQNAIVETQMVFYASNKWNLERKKSVNRTLFLFTD